MKKISRNKDRINRAKRGKTHILGTIKRPRICVFRSLRGLYVQLVDDSIGKTIAAFSYKNSKKDKGVDMAKKIGQDLAKKCLDMKIEEAVFDRNGYKYHGKVKAVADGAREGGIKF